jgi:hypothetical protein
MMSITPFFRELRSAYQAELDDLTSDSEGKNVLRKRLEQKRKELPFLIQMMELSPEMVAVVFHQGFRFSQPAVMKDLLGRESDEFPQWERLAEVITLTPQAQELANIILKEPMGEWFMAVAVGLEYMFSTPDRSHAPHAAHDDDEDKDEDDNASDDRGDDLNDDEDGEARAGEEAGADWMVEQGFDRKD